MKNQNEKLRRVITLLHELLEILQCENSEHIKTVENMIAIGIDKKNTNENIKLKEISQSYRSAMRVTSSGLGDFFIWEDDFDKRILANKKLDKLRKELWTLLSWEGYNIIGEL